jgi:hypothetical protein
MAVQPTTSLSAAQLAHYRAQTYALKPTARLKNESDALRFVNQRGFIYFWPIKGVELPSLWVAVAGDRPVADQHNDPGHKTWGWKDNLLGAKKWFYAKVLRGRATIISLQTLPYFYALSENYGDPHHDYLLQYEEGRLTIEAKTIFETLLEKGPMHTVALRKEVHLGGKERNSRFERALTELQVGLKILPVGVANAGAWHYSFIYEVVDRWFPDLSAQARSIGRSEARIHLTDLYLKSVGAATETQIAKLFSWRPQEVRRACEDLLSRSLARQVEGGAGWATAALAS